jgi:hypothetical protein
MVGLAEAKLAVDVLAGGAALIDKIYPALRWIVTGKRDDEDHSVHIEKRDDGIAAVRKDGALMKVTYAEVMERLSTDDVAVIQAHEKRIGNVVPIVEELYAELELMGGDEKARERQKLKKRVASVKTDLEAILGYIQSVGLDLDDHYSRARHWISVEIGAG